MIIYPKPFAGSQLETWNIIALLKEEFNIDVFVTFGGLYCSDSNVSVDLCAFLENHNIPFHSGNVTFSKQIQNEGFYKQ